MREFEGYDYEQIAEMTGTTEMNVKVRITRAKKQLRELLTPYYKSRAAKSTRKSAKQEIDTEFFDDPSEDLSGLSTEDLALSS